MFGIVAQIQIGKIFEGDTVGLLFLSDDQGCPSQAVTGRVDALRGQNQKA